MLSHHSVAGDDDNRLSRRQDEFVAMLSHELRNPLAAIVTALEVIKLRDGMLGRELAVIDRHAAALVELVDDLLDISRLNGGQIRLEKAPCDVAPAIEQAVEALRKQIDGASHDLHIDVAKDLLVDADRVRFIQVVGNLLGNSVQYTPPNGRIEILARDVSGTIEVVVRDNGKGIEASLLPSIFDAFVQGSRTIDRRHGGIGIGLTIAKQLTEMHGGTLVAQSDGPGRGATFTLRWPRAKITPMTRHPLRILVIDHDIEATRAFAQAVSMMGHDIRVAHDVEGALRVADGFTAEVVFIEVAIEGGGGYALAEQLRDMPGYPTTRMIAIGPGERVRLESARFEEHITSSLDVGKVTSLLGNV